MRKTGYFYLILLLNIFLLQGCMDVKMDTGEIIVSPQNQAMPIKGTWIVAKEELQENQVLPKDEINELIGKTVAFDLDRVVFDQEVYGEVKYKIKNVDTRDYFSYTYKINSKDLGVHDKNVEVVSITSHEKHIYDMVRIKENRLMVYKDHSFFYLEKLSDEIGDGKLAANTLQKEKALKGEPDILHSGVLIGLHSNSQETVVEEGKNYKISKPLYRTLWISTKDRELYPILEAENLFVPRKSGFWMLEMNRDITEGIIQDRAKAYPVKTLIAKKESDSENYMKLDEQQKIIPKEHKLKNIQYVSNDYAIIEYWRMSDLEDVPIKRIQVLPMDNIENYAGINISDIVGEEGRLAILNSAKAYLSTLNQDEVEQLDNKVREDSFTLVRRNGHWIMRGWLYYNDISKANNHVEFNINMIPPEKLVNYDELYVSWNDIKTRVPEAIDAYTSPNREFVLIITKYELYVYELKDHMIGTRYLEKIQLKDNESIVMAEWAVGNYVNRWEKSFKEIARPIN